MENVVYVSKDVNKSCKKSHYLKNISDLYIIYEEWFCSWSPDECGSVLHCWFIHKCFTDELNNNPHILGAVNIVVKLILYASHFSYEAQVQVQGDLFASA